MDLLKGIEIFATQVQDNIRSNYRELVERKIVLESYPMKLFLEPTQRCNLNCITCGIQRRMEKNDMSMDLFRSIERQLFPYVAEVDFFMNGEPVFCKNLEEMLKTSEKYSFLPKLFTNGTWWTDRMIGLWSELGVFVNVSFDGGTKETFEKVRVNANFDMVLKNIQRLRARQKVGHPRSHVRLAVTTGMYNIDEALRIAELAKSMDIDDVMFGSLDWEDTPEQRWSLRNDPEKVIGIFRRTKDWCDEQKIRFSCSKKVGDVPVGDNHNWYQFEIPVDRYAPLVLESFNPCEGDCSYPWTQTAVRVGGRVVACCQRHQHVGDWDQSPFRQIWNGEPYQRLRSQSSFYECLGQECRMAAYSVWNGGVDRPPLRASSPDEPAPGERHSKK